jgi:hypothetical protein
MAAAIACTNFEEKSGKLAGLFSVSLPRPMSAQASPASKPDCLKLATNGTEAVA